jgi:PAS domain S-box-containing protein
VAPVRSQHFGFRPAINQSSGGLPAATTARRPCPGYLLDLGTPRPTAALAMMKRSHALRQDRTAIDIGRVREPVSEEQPRSEVREVPDSNELLAAIFESSTEFAIFATDKGGQVISWNTGAERLLGYVADEIIGRDADVIFTPEDRASGVPALERLTAAEKGRAGDERWHQRKDGSRFWSSGLLMPLRGRVQGFIKIMRDRTEQHEAAKKIRESEERFRLLATGIPELVFRSHGTGHRTWGSPQWEMFTGLSDLASQGLGWLDAIHPDDRALTLEAWDQAQRTREYHVEHRIRRHPDGFYRWHLTRARPVSDSDGSASDDWVGTSADIDDIRALQGRQQLLVAELHHRTRNLLAVVQAVARRTLRSSSSLEAFGSDFEDRVLALSRVQGLLSVSEQGVIELRDLIFAELAAHAENSSKVRVEGPPLRLSPTTAQTLALALHELATNALKYGALVEPAGRLSVTWHTEQQIDHSSVVLEWHESGVPVRKDLAQMRKGYGRELLERGLPSQLKAKTSFVFETDGVHCTIEAPIVSKRNGEVRFDDLPDM